MTSGHISYINSKFILLHVSSSIRTITVGTGISPVQSHRESRTITAGRELHPALKKHFNYRNKCNTIFWKNNQLFWF